MADSLTLIVLVAAGGSPSGTEALLQAAHESLGSETRIDVRETPREPTDVDALSTERSGRADAVAELAYKDRKHRQVTLRVHVAKPRRWLERTLIFDPSDVEVERARTLGYAMAAILPEPFPHHLEEPKPPSPPEPPPPPPPPAPPPPPKPEAPAMPLVPVDAPRRTSIELLAVAETGVGGDADAAGGALAVQVAVVPPVSLRFAGGLEGGSIGSVDVQTVAGFISAGVVFHAIRPTSAQPVGISMRADYLLMYEQGSQAEASQAQAKAISGVDSVVELGLQFVRGTEAVAGLGLDAMFPKFNIEAVVPVNGVDTAKTATIPVFRLTGEVGLRVFF